MRYGIFSDVHGNLEAFKVALKYCRREKIDKFIYLGDIVGYGANPSECIALLTSLNPVCIAGNHDWAAAGRFPLCYFNPVAKEAIIWTKNVLTEVNISFLHKLPLVYREKSSVYVHGSLFEPYNFHYILDADDARKNFLFFKKRICFIGHSHCKGVYALWNDKISFLGSDCVEIEKGARYIINVGSVGQPRDRDNRLCFCIYDDKIGIVEFRRLKYNIKRAAEKILEAGLPSFLAYRLHEGF